MRILLAEDDLLFVTGLQDLLIEHDAFHLDAIYRDQAALERAMADASPGIVLISAGLVQDLPQLAAIARHAGHRLALLLRSGAEPEYPLVPELYGLLHYHLPEALLLAGLTTMAQGVRWTGAGTTHAQATDTASARVLSQLSGRQLQVMSEVARGEKNAVIASRIGTSEQVVKNMLRKIYDLTGVSDRLELALFVLHHPELSSATETARIQQSPKQTTASR